MISQKVGLWSYPTRKVERLLSKPTTETKSRFKRVLSTLFIYTDKRHTIPLNSYLHSDIDLWSVTLQLENERFLWTINQPSTHVDVYDRTTQHKRLVLGNERLWILRYTFYIQIF